MIAGAPRSALPARSSNGLSKTNMPPTLLMLELRRME